MTKKNLNIKKLRPLKLWCGRLPEIYGYGLIVFECTEDQARKTLKREFYKMKKAWHGELTYLKAMDFFGGDIFQIETGKAYDDNIGN